MSVQSRQHRPNPPRFPRQWGRLRVCLGCRDAGRIIGTMKRGNKITGVIEDVQVWAPATLELCGQKDVTLPDAVSKRPTKTTIRLYIHARGQTKCQSMFEKQYQQAASSQAG